MFHRTLRLSALMPAILSISLFAAPAQTAPAQTAPAPFERFTYAGKWAEKIMVKPGEYRNPILTGYYPDPSVTRVGDDYYLVNSSFAHYPGLPIFRSRDLVNWTQIANAIDRPEQLDFEGRRISQAVFAPDIGYHDGLFYIVNTCVDCKGNFVITAKDPAGPWSDPIWLPFEGIDPSSPNPLYPAAATSPMSRNLTALSCRWNGSASVRRKSPSIISRAARWRWTAARALAI